MPLPIFTIDAFTDKPFSGNPAAVCLLDTDADPAWMQNVGREMNLSETAFLVPKGDENTYSLRWFTPTVEVNLCGHATLASAHALWTEGRADTRALLRFDTMSGELTARRLDDGWIELEFPLLASHATAPSMELTVALGAQPVHASRSSHLLLCEMESEATVRGLSPDFANLGKLADTNCVGVTARAADPGAGYDFVSRFFAPALGIDEDPVTGSAHCTLAPYWMPRLGKSEMTGYQASSRGGTVRIAIDGDRVKLRGQAVTVARGELLI